MNLPFDQRQALLTPVIEGYRKTPFVWRVHDCVLFAARCVDAQIGTRLEANLLRDYQYTGPVPAIRIVKDAGGWEVGISRYLGPSVAPAELEFGDVVLGRANPPATKSYSSRPAQRNCSGCR